MGDRKGSMRVLLATDEASYADAVYAVADELGLDVTAMSTERDIGASARRIGANVVVFDAGDDFAPTARAAAVFAESHPGVLVCVTATGVDDHLSDGWAGGSPPPCRTRAAPRRESWT